MARKLSGVDIKPQFLRGFIIESGANTYTEKVIATPNLTEAGFVMEILKIFYEIESVLAEVSGDGILFAIQETSRVAVPDISDAGVILKERWMLLVVTEGGKYTKLTSVVDYTDGAGNGLLSARKELLMSVEGISQTIPMIIHFAILYRLVKVSPAEIVGLISS
jgi:hypothetical protein